MYAGKGSTYTHCRQFSTNKNNASSECSKIWTPMFGVQTSKNRVLSAPQIDSICGEERKMVNLYVYLSNITKKSRYFNADTQIKKIKMVVLRVPSSKKENKFNTVLCVSAYLCIF